MSKTAAEPGWTIYPKASRGRLSSLIRAYRFTGTLMLVYLAAFLGGCTAPNLESAHFGEPALFRSEIKRFYARHASEEDGRCNHPYIDAITMVDVLKDTPEQWVAEIRYRYLDRVRDEDPGSDRKVCFGFASRIFTLVPVNSSLVVADMSGTDCAGRLFSLNRALGLERRTRTCP